MRTPVLMLVGQAGSGKDTVASFLERRGCVSVALADPMKRLCRDLYGFTEEQLWGPSHLRSQPAPNAHRPFERWSRVVFPWVRQVLPNVTGRAELAEVRWALFQWARAFEQSHEPPSARLALQTLGTEWGRAFDRQMWVDYALRIAREMLRGGFSYDRASGLRVDIGVLPPDWVVITDGRFRNEVLTVREMGGVVVRIESPGSGLHGAAGGHSSEVDQASIPSHLFDALLVNDKAHGLTACGRMVDGLMSTLTRGPSIHATRPNLPAAESVAWGSQ